MICRFSKVPGSRTAQEATADEHLDRSLDLLVLVYIYELRTSPGAKTQDLQERFLGLCIDTLGKIDRYMTRGALSPGIQ